MEQNIMNFYDYLKAAAAEYGERPALTCGPKSISFSQLDVATDVCALRLMAKGIRPGDKVVLWGVSTIEWVISYYGALKAGAVAVLMNYGLKGEEVADLAKMVDASAFVIGGNSVSVTDPMEAAKVAVMAGAAQDKIFPETKIAALSELLKDPAAPMADYPENITKENLGVLAVLNQNIDPKQSQVIIYTSGTTSKPKGVMLSAHSILSDIDMAAEKLGEYINKPACLALPLFHSYGLTVMGIVHKLGSNVILVPDIKPDKIRDIISTFKTELLATVGAVYGMLTQLPDFAERIVPAVRICVTGGGFTTPVEMMRLEKAFANAKIICGYGMTECSPIISVQHPDEPLEERAFTVGKPLEGMDVRMWSETEGFLADGEIGEIIVKGPNLMNGYFGFADEDQPFDEDGYLHTGDLGFFDEKGVLHFAGRVKDMIIRSGENISPVDIEQALLEEDNIKEAKVMGAAHPIWGESVEACITVSGELDEDALRARLKTKLSSYKVPSHFFVFDAFPLNTNGKLDQRTLKADMLRRVREIAIADSLNEGFTVMKLNLQNKLYNIVPVCSMIEEFSSQIGFAKVQSVRIRLSVEEMITDRINNAYDKNGEMKMEVQLMPQWLRLKFTDNGREYRLDSEEASISAKIIVGNVDAYYSESTEYGEATYILDYNYAEGFDVKRYLMYHSES